MPRQSLGSRLLVSGGLRTFSSFFFLSIVILWIPLVVLHMLQMLGQLLCEAGILGKNAGPGTPTFPSQPSARLHEVRCSEPAARIANMWISKVQLYHHPLQPQLGFHHHRCLCPEGSGLLQTQRVQVLNCLTLLACSNHPKRRSTSSLHH